MSARRLSRLSRERALRRSSMRRVLPCCPFLWLATTAYKPSRDIFSIPPTLPVHADAASSSARVFHLFDVAQPARIEPPDRRAARSVLSLLLGVPAGYALARSQQRATPSASAYFFLAIRMVPAVATLIPFYLMMRDVGLLGSWVAVVLINTMLNSAFVTWMMFSYFRSPAEGNGGSGAHRRLHAVRRLLARRRCRPCAPGIIASALFCLMFSWNDFLYPMFLTRLDSKPISVALLVRLRHQGHHLGHARRARAFLDDPDRADRARAQPLFRAGPDQGHPLTPLVAAPAVRPGPGRHPRRPRFRSSRRSHPTRERAPRPRYRRDRRCGQAASAR